MGSPGEQIFRVLNCPRSLGRTHAVAACPDIHLREQRCSGAVHEDWTKVSVTEVALCHAELWPVGWTPKTGERLVVFSKVPLPSSRLLAGKNRHVGSIISP